MKLPKTALRTFTARATIGWFGVGAPFRRARLRVAWRHQVQLTDACKPADAQAPAATKPHCFRVSPVVARIGSQNVRGGYDDAHRLELTQGAIVVADNILSHDLRAYVAHVRQRSDAHSVTLPIGKGLELTRIG